MSLKLDDLSFEMKRVLTVYPLRRPVKWYYRNNIIVLEYPKDLNNIERKVWQFIGGPMTIKRPLDQMGTEIWLLCDGRHRVLDICTHMDATYHEAIEPVFPRVWSFLEILLKLGLMRLLDKPRPLRKLRQLKGGSVDSQSEVV